MMQVTEMQLFVAFVSVRGAVEDIPEQSAPMESCKLTTRGGFQ